MRGRQPGQSLCIAYMAKRFDGTGVVKVQCSEGAFSRLKLDQLPWPNELGWVEGGRRFMYMDTRQMGADSMRYRVVWPELANGPGSKNRTSSFTLIGAHVNETLYVLAEFLRDQGVEFLGLANRHGSAFSDVRLTGSKLAYLTRDIPHSPACHVNFLAADAPEV